MNIKTNANGYIEWSDGLPVRVYNKESIAQNIRSNIRTWKGEWFLNRILGVDYIRGFQKGQQRVLIYEIKKAILDTVGVQEILEFKVDIDNRVITIDAQIETVEGIVNYKEVI